MPEELQGENWLLACDPETHTWAKLQWVCVCVSLREAKKKEKRDCKRRKTGS